MKIRKGPFGTYSLYPTKIRDVSVGFEDSTRTGDSMHKYYLNAHDYAAEYILTAASLVRVVDKNRAHIIGFDFLRVEHDEI